MAQLMTLVVFSMVILQERTSAQATTDPCSPDVHEDLPYPMGRSSNCPSKLSSFCDNYLSPDWYKVDIATPMPTECVEMNSCGVSIPIWMNGSIPMANDGVVDRTACINFRECCFKTIPIKMKNCTTFLAYYLPTAPFCPTVYCFGTDEICEESTVSPDITTSAETTKSPECDEWTFGPECTHCHCVASNTVSCSTIDGVCTCKDGWEGKLCEVDVNECMYGVCRERNSECVNEPGTYKCQCAAGYWPKQGLCEECDDWTYGTNCSYHCECDVDKTTKCSDVTGACFCNSGWTGPDCGTPLDECFSIECEEFAVCVNEHDTYSCQCMSGYRKHGGVCVFLNEFHAEKEFGEHECGGVSWYLIAGLIIPLLLINIASIVITYLMTRRIYRSKTSSDYEKLQIQKDTWLQDPIYQLPYISLITGKDEPPSYENCKSTVDGQQQEEGLEKKDDLYSEI